MEGRSEKPTGPKIHVLEMERVKKVKHFVSELSPGVNIIGGNNGQGKTSILDFITWLCKGHIKKPSNPQNSDSVQPPIGKIEFDNGYTIELKGTKDHKIVVTDNNGRTGGVKLLEGMISDLALDIRTFISLSNSEKANKLLEYKGIDKELNILKSKEKSKYEERLLVGREKDQKSKYAAGLEHDISFGTEIQHPQDLINQQQAILLRNAENQKKRDNLEDLKRKKLILENEEQQIQKQISQLQNNLLNIQQQLTNSIEDIEIAEKTSAELEDESTELLRQKLEEIETHNANVRKNLEYSAAVEEAEEKENEYNALTEEIDSIRAKKKALLDSADLPLPGLSIEDGELIYNGQKWDCMSGAEQLIVSVAIVRETSPECGFVLLDKTEQFDKKTLIEFTEWVNQQGLQVIATRVSDGDECQIIIEDGEIVHNAIKTKEDFEPEEENTEEYGDF